MDPFILDQFLAGWWTSLLDNNHCIDEAYSPVLALKYLYPEKDWRKKQTILVLFLLFLDENTNIISTVGIKNNAKSWPNPIFQKKTRQPTTPDKTQPWHPAKTMCKELLMDVMPIRERLVGKVPVPYLFLYMWNFLEARHAKVLHHDLISKSHKNLSNSLLNTISGRSHRSCSLL